MRRALFLVVLAVACRQTAEAVPDEPARKKSKPAASAEVPIELPKASSGGESIAVLAVNIDAGGKVTIDGKVVPDADIEKHARAARAANPELRAVISADAATPYGRVIAVIDAVKRAGIAKIAFGVGAAGAAAPPPPTVP